MHFVLFAFSLVFVAVISFGGAENLLLVTCCVFDGNTQSDWLDRIAAFVCFT